MNILKTILWLNLLTFKRIIKNQTFYFIDGQLDYKEKLNTFSFIKNLNPRAFLNNDFITMDLETRTMNGVMTPYCISVYDGENLQSFYLTDYYNEKFMLRASIDFLLKIKYHNQKVYLHNFSKFDVTFLLSTLSNEHTKLKPIIRDGRFLTLKLAILINTIII